MLEITRQEVLTLNTMKRWIGIAGAVLSGAVLVLSLLGVVGPGCGGDGGDACQAACGNVKAKCNSSSSSYTASDVSACLDSCRALSSSSSLTQSSLSENSFLIDCVAKAPTCDAIAICTNSSGPF